MTTILGYQEIPVLLASNNPLTLASQGTTVLTGVGGDPVTYASLTALLLPLKADLAVLQTTTAAATGPTASPNATKARNKAQKTVKTDLDNICHGLKILCNDHPDAGLLITKAGYKIKKHTIAERAEFWLSYTLIMGEVLAHIRAPAKRYVADWQVSGDHGTSWTGDWMDRSTFLFQGLTPGVTYLFRYRTKVKGVIGPWATAIPLMAK